MGQVGSGVGRFDGGGGVGVGLVSFFLFLLGEGGKVDGKRKETEAHYFGGVGK